MKKNSSQKCCRVIFIVMLLCLGYVNGAPIAEKTADTKPVAWWNFNSSDSRIITDEVSNVEDSIHGNFKFVDGPDGTALKLDGFTTGIIREFDMVPALGDSFTFEAWIAAATYPWNWCPVLAQEQDEGNGILFWSGATGSGWNICLRERSMAKLRNGSENRVEKVGSPGSEL